MTLQIEEGKYYRTQNGRKVGPMRWRNVSPTEHPFDIDHRTGIHDADVNATVWTPYGRSYDERNLDLVAEWVDDPAKEALDILTPDLINHPPHYTGHPSGVECIQITEHMNFCRGNAIKYIWRAGEKGDEVEDLKKARWYLDREIARLTQEPA